MEQEPFRQPLYVPLWQKLFFAGLHIAVFTTTGTPFLRDIYK
jgi:hypothetical protein